jgi:hypothetical protein
MSLWSFQGACELRARPTERRRREDRAGLSKLNSVRNIEVDIVLGEPNAGRLQNTAINGVGAYRRETPASLERR